MDTRFWGPSGWKFLHLTTFFYEPSENKYKMSKFLETIPFILPCKFCRASLTEYYDNRPFKPALKSAPRLIKWMYDIHNDVNDKLRKQHLNPNDDPTFDSVKRYYEIWIRDSTPEERLQTFWDFLFSVAYCHPVDTSRTSKPMPRCPPYANTCKSDKIRNRWNTLKSSIRLRWYKHFWSSLPDILEPELRDKWVSACKITHPNLSCRRSTVAWLWRMRCSLDDTFKDPYTQVCRKIAVHSSDCHSSVRAKTCRKKHT